MRPHAPAQGVRESVYVSAAVAPDAGLMTALILPDANSDLMNLFLAHVSQTFSKYFIVMQVDQAGWHHSNELIIPTTMRLIEQPAYRPEGNPVEPMWEELREKYLDNHSFASTLPLD
jgi:hypothetical protein